jgi:TonB family protein
MTTLESWLLAYLLNSLWQVPLVFFAAWAASRLVQRRVAIEHRLWVTALLLDALLPACSLDPGAALRALWQFVLRSAGEPSATGSVHVTVTTGAAYAHTMLRLPSALLTGIIIAYAACTIYLAARLLWRLFRTNTLRREAQPITPTGALQTIWEQCSRAFQLRNAQLASSSGIAGPLTIGIRHRTILLPTAMLPSLSDDDLTAAIAHEFAHMRRQDFAKNLFYRMLSLPIAWHPLLWLTQTRLTETREMLCDALAAEAACGRESYARSLLRLASALTGNTPVPSLHAIGIFDASIFERRIMNLTQKQIKWKPARRLATMATCTLMAFGTCAFAMSMRMGISTPSVQNETQTAVGHALHVQSGVMAGNLFTKVNPVYPPEAKKAKIGGIVVLHAIIGKDGKMKALKVISGPPLLRTASLDAVKQWTYKPYLLNGNPTEVETTITVNFSLNH